MKCPTCSSELVTGQKYCPQCGTNVAALTLPEPPAGPLPFAPPTVVAPVAPLAPPPTDNFAVVEQTVPAAKPKDPVITNPIAASPVTVPPTLGDPAPAEPVSGQVPQWVNRWSLPEDTAADETRYDDTRYDDTRYDETRFDQTHYDQTHYDETHEHEVQAPANRSQLIIGPPTSAVSYPAGYAPGAVDVPGRGSTMLAVIAGVAGLAAIIAAFLPVLTVSTDAPIPERGDYNLNDLSLGTNVIVGAVVIGVLLLGGGILATLGKRFGAGLAAGATVALAPVIAVIWGGIDVTSAHAEAQAIAAAAAGQGGTFYQAKQGAGLWVLIAAAVLGLVALAISLVQAGPDGRPRLNMVIGLFGALAAVVAAVGQMIPNEFRSLGDNFDNAIATNTILYGRLAMILLVAVVGAVGFLCNNRWGLGLALGGAAFWGWQWLSSLTELGEISLPPGFVPLSTLDGKPHIVTTIGVVAVVVLATVSLLTAPKSRTLAG